MSLVMVVSLAAVVPAVTVEAGNDISGVSKDFGYTAYDDGTLGITGYFGPSAIVTIPSKLVGREVSFVSPWAFDRCSNLTDINVDSNNNNYSSKDGILFNKNKTELIRYPIGNTRQSYAIPNSVTSIGYEAFCTNLKDVYYTGSESQWDRISIDIGNESLYNATIHYNYSESKELNGTVYYQQKIDKSAVRFIAEVDIEDVKNANSGNVKFLFDNEEYNIEIKTAYHSILANGHKVEAKQGKCFIVSPTIPINNDDKNLVTAQFTLDSCNGSLIRELIYNT